VQYAVYIAVPVGEDPDPIIAAASKLGLPGFPFRIRQHSDPSEASDGELFLRVSGVEEGGEALERALQVYIAAREAAGLRPDHQVEPSLTPVARQY
jgi:hypothetical protein